MKKLANIPLVLVLLALLAPMLIAQSKEKDKDQAAPVRRLAS